LKIRQGSRGRSSDGKFEALPIQPRSRAPFAAAESRIRNRVRGSKPVPSSTAPSRMNFARGTSCYQRKPRGRAAKKSGSNILHRNPRTHRLAQSMREAPRVSQAARQWLAIGHGFAKSHGETSTPENTLARAICFDLPNHGTLRFPCCPSSLSITTATT
jgi:hypothetical protein